MLSVEKVVLIQNWYRCCRAHMELRFQEVWQILQTLEFHSQCQQAKLFYFFMELMSLLPEQNKNSYGNEAFFVMEPERYKKKVKIVVEAVKNEWEKCSVARIALPLNKNSFQKILECMRRDKNSLLPPSMILYVLKAATLKLQKLPNINDIKTDSAGVISICGSLFGNLQDLLMIFHKNALPSSSNPYIFNGDFVDHGSHGIEVLIIILASFLVFDGFVHLNRGDHEDFVMNLRYGFNQELQNKYATESAQLIKQIDEVFRWLPLASIVDGRVFVVHGGISKTSKLKELAVLKRETYVSVLCPQSKKYCKKEWTQIFHLLWSNPCNHELPDGLICTQHSGKYFKAAFSQHFCALNKFDYIVSSNDFVESGYKTGLNQTVWTVFSASNFHGLHSNDGAYLKITKAKTPLCVTYNTAKDSRVSKMTLHEQINVIEESALRQLTVHLCSHHNSLLAAFKTCDVDQTGTISLGAWCKCMQEVTSFNLPWQSLHTKLATVVMNEKNKRIAFIDYNATLRLLDSDNDQLEYKFHDIGVLDLINNNQKVKQAIFSILNTDNNGLISFDQFSNACDILEKYGSGTQIKRVLIKMLKLMDINEDGYVNFNEFSEAFRLSDRYRLTKKRSSSKTKSNISSLSVP